MAKSPRWIPPPKLTCQSCKTAKIAEWCALPSGDLHLIDVEKVTRRYAAGETVYHQGDACIGIHCMESGLVALRVSDADGNSKMLRTVDAGQTLGSSDYFAGKGYRATATCMKDAVICHVPGAAVRKTMQKSPALGLAFLAHGAEELERANTAALQQALYPVRTRLAQLLLDFKDKHGTSSADGAIEMELPVTWQDAADLIGARPETISRSVQALVRDRIIVTSGRKVVIADLDLLLDEIEVRTE